MSHLRSGTRILAGVAVTALLVVGCSSGAPEPAPVPPPPPPTPTVAPPPVVPAGETSPLAVTVAEASADPALGFLLAAGDPAACLESQGGTRPGVGTVLDGRAVLGACREVPGQAWSFAALSPAPAPPAPAPGGDPAAAAAPAPAPTTYRIHNRTRDEVELCFEGSPRVAPDGAANTPCADLATQRWHVEPTNAGYYRLRTDASDQACLGLATPDPAAGPPTPGAPGVALVPCEPLERPAGTPRSAQDWELTPAPELPEPPPPPPAPEPEAAPPAPAAPRTVIDELLASVNAQRAAAGCGPVSRDARLDRAAESHARWMDSGGAFSHTGEGGTSPRDRARAQGWSAGTGENIARGQTSVDGVMDDWMNSPGHRRNILDCEWSSVGLARTGSSDGPTWVQNFGG